MRYRMDYDWLWKYPPGNDGTTATVRLTISGANVRKQVENWLAQLAQENDGIFGAGGWSVKAREVKWDRAVLEITSGGEDVADGIEFGTDAAYAYFSAFGFSLQWEQLPRGSVMR